MRHFLKTAGIVLALASPVFVLNAQTPTPKSPAPTTKPTEPPKPVPADPQRPVTPEDQKQRATSDPQRGKPATQDPAQATMAQPSSTSIWVGGQPMYSDRNIVVNGDNSRSHSTLMSAVKSAGLTATLEGAGPFTVFAPVNDAFENLPAGTVETWMKPENSTALKGTLKYHVVEGRYDFDALSAMLKRGQSTLRTVGGGMLTLSMNGPHNILVKDESGNTANIITYDIYQSNGVVHSIDNVLLPKNK